MIVGLLLFRQIGRFIFNRSRMLLSLNSLLRGIKINEKVANGRILQVRTMLYELLTHCIPPTTIIKVCLFLTAVDVESCTSTAAKVGRGVET